MPDSNVLLTGIEPEDYSDIELELGKEYAERLVADLIDVYENGIADMVPKKGKRLLEYFRSQTPALDEPLLMDRDYLKKRETGEAPRLWCEVMAEDYQMAQAQGVMTEPPPMLWPMLMPPSLPPELFRRVQSDYIRLMRAEEKTT